MNHLLKMKRMKIFKIGGIHPEDNKLSKGIEVEVFPYPNRQPYL